MKVKPNLYLVTRDDVVTKFPWIVISAESGESALWTHNAKVGRVPMRFRSEAIAQSAADALNYAAST